MTKSNIIWLASLAIALFAFSCNDDEMVMTPEEPELITTLTYTLTPEDGGDAIVLSFNDPDGDGGTAPTVTVENLTTNTNYDGAITLSNESVTPSEDITAEVQEEDDEHQFFYATTVGELAITYDDVDGNNNPIGLKTKVTTGPAGTGTLTLTLRHQPNKSGDNVASGDITNAGGDTDIEVTFDIVIE